MRRWNGWGDDAQDYPLSGSVLRFVESRLGDLRSFPDVLLRNLLRTISDSGLKSHPLIDDSQEARLRHARGQSLPDWIALRYGRLPASPDGVAQPTSEEDLRELMAYAGRTGARLIPCGGGTSVVGGVNSQPSEEPVLTVDLRGLNRLLDLDETSRLATFEAGATGPEIEAALNQHGYTLGHFPQSWEYSTLGGWVATRSSGQQSLHYGRIEELFAGGRLETPSGRLDLPPFPASAAGPDLRQLVLGSEGRLGFITQAIVRIRPLPARERFYGALFHDWESGVQAVREIVQAELPLSMLRLSNPVETEFSLLLLGNERQALWADRLIRALGFGEGRCLLVYAVTGESWVVYRMTRVVNGMIRSGRGYPVGRLPGEAWRKSRFKTPYLRNTLWEAGVAVDTVETAVPWSKVLSTAEAMEASLREAAAGFGERLHVISHLSHVYRDGASVYTTLLFRRTADPDELLERWQAMKKAVSEAILANGGTISHQHGVGRDHAPYLEAEKGALGIEALESARRALDPEGILNTGVLLEDAT